MTCPKCGGEMRRYERNGVDVDQCGDCRGIFLDRGELERLTEAESSYYAGGGDRGRQEQPRAGGYGGHESHGHGGYGSYGKKKKKRSFLDELFD